MRQNSGKMSKEALINGQRPFGRDSLVKAVKDAIVEIARLVVQAGHDCVYSMSASPTCNVPELAISYLVGA